MKISTVIDHLEKYFPFAIQEPWDKCGLQIGSLEKTTEKVMVSLNCDLASISKAIESKCNLLITHHPFLLNRIENYDLSSSATQMLSLALKNNLTIVSFHTCLDKGMGEESMNHWLINKLPVTNIASYDETKIGKIAALDREYAPDEFIDLVKEVFELPFVRVNNPNIEKIATVAICGGSAFDDVYRLAGQVDCFISGDSKYHISGDATASGLLMIDASHHLEVIMEQEVARLLEALELEVLVANSVDYLEVK